ncbi:chondroitin sulfate ABC exolyase-like [Oculina patagonica]
MVRFWHFAVLLFLFVQANQAAPRTVYDFEDVSDLSDFVASPTSTLELTTVRFKKGAKSLNWTWESEDTITHSFPTNIIEDKELNNGGIKLWLYNTDPRAGEELNVSFVDTLTTPADPVIVAQFNISLDFKGWRGIWVSYEESMLVTGHDIDQLIITAPETSEPTNPLFIDLLRLVDNLRRQSRDKIVPTIGDGIYNPNHFWQQTYRWSQATPTAITEPTPDEDKLNNLTLVEKRLENWFVKQSQSSVQFTGNAKKRWDSLQEHVDRAHVEYGQLTIRKIDGVITGKPLYPQASEFNDEEFGRVMQRILLPMALDYHVRSREIDIDELAADQLSNLNGDDTAKNEAIEKIVGADSEFQQTFTDTLGTTPPDYTVEKVKEAIKAVNESRWQRLLLLLEYIEDQGFTEGSGLGSLDHEMNNAGAGFMNAVFLLKKELKALGKLSDYVATMKWYNDFGEIYQDPFEYAGTTADRLRTISLWRLFAVLLMPTSTTVEQQHKIRDMKALGRWYANAISPNEGLAGTLKPDYLGFHHNSFYASAYTPHALHKAALIEYLLSGTPFAFSDETSGHIKKGLESMRIVAVKYSTPNSVSGRFPGFSRAILAKNFPAYAYIGATAPAENDDGSLGEITISTENVKMFLRLYDTADSEVNDYLGDGKIFTSIYYLNSIGSINILEEISSKAATMSIAAEGSPQGCWTKNYAAFIVQRRDDWAVSVKGFNKYVWDFEASGNQNVFGLYQSHGALLVANSEAALLTHDIDNGWDWTRHPGTTTIKMNLEQLISDNRRYYQPMELAGGLTLVGGGQYSSGMFGMDFSQPPYRFPNGAFQLDITFTFRKSVFFADYVIICLGKGITATESSPNITQTALFQTKLLDVSNPSSIRINDTTHALDTDLTKVPNDFGTDDYAATLMDVNGNSYYIPQANSQGLNTKISLQKSRDQRGRARETSARYATAWLDHGVNPTDGEYEYAIVVNQAPNVVRVLADRQASADNKVYEVLQKDEDVHIVKINDCPRPGETQYGYVFFTTDARLRNGPIRRVNKAPCLVMVEEVDRRNLYIAVSSPNLNFNITNDLDIGSQVNGDERFYSFSRPVDIEVI